MDNNLTLARFRKRLQQTELPVTIIERSISELEQDAKRLVPLYLGKSKSIRPSRQAFEFKQMEKGLKRAADAMERLGPDHLDTVFNMIWGNSDTDGIDIRQHMDYVRRLSIYSARANELAEDETRTTGKSKRGRPTDENLRDLVLGLMIRFERFLSIRPTYTAHKETGLGISLFDAFVKEAIAQYAPEGVFIEPRKIDGATRWALSSRDIVFCEPPRLPES